MRFLGFEKALSLAKVLDIKFEVPSCLGSPWPGLNAPGANMFGGGGRRRRRRTSTDNKALQAKL